MDTPTIKEYDGQDYTQINFEPDLKRFGLKELDNDIFKLFERRVYDLAGCSPKTVNVYFNDKKINVKTFEEYFNLYLKDDDKIYEKVNNRWEVGIAV